MIEALKNLGLTNNEIKVYTTLLKIGSAKSGKIVSESKIMVHPSTWEGFPRTIIESLACKVPIIALSSTIKGLIKDGEHGFLVEEKDLYKKVSELLQDENLILKMGNNGRKLATEKYGKESTIQVLKRMYEFLWMEKR